MANILTYSQKYMSAHKNHKGGSMPMMHSKAMIKSHSMPMGGGMHGKRSGVSKEAAGYISRKISKLRHEGKSQKAAVGQAFGMARGKGYKVPKRKR